MAKARKTWKLVLTTVILSIIVLAAFTAAFITLIVPSYNITEEQIYSVLTKALPILIGLIFVEIALISSRRGDDDYKDNIDKLSPNAYDSPLYTAPVDDPAFANKDNANAFNMASSYAAGSVKEIVKEVPVEVIKEVVKEVPVEIIREVPVEVEKINTVEVPVVKEVIKEVPVEVIKEVEVPVIKEVPVETIVEKTVEVPVEKIVQVPVEIIKEVEVPVIQEVIKEVPVEVIKEVASEPVVIVKHEVEPMEIQVPVEVIKEVEVPVEVIKEIIREVPVEVIKEVEVPVEVIKEVVREVPVEVIKEVEKEVPVEVEKVVAAGQKDVILSFQEALEEEMAAAKDGSYPLTLVAVKNGVEETVSTAFDVPVFTEGTTIFAILPFTRTKDIAATVKSLNGKAVQMTPRHTAESLKKEASK